MQGLTSDSPWEVKSISGGEDKTKQGISQEATCRCQRLPKLFTKLEEKIQGLKNAKNKKGKNKVHIILPTMISRGKSLPIPLGKTFHPIRKIGYSLKIAFQVNLFWTKLTI